MDKQEIGQAIDNLYPTFGTTKRSINSSGNLSEYGGSIKIEK